MRSTWRSLPALAMTAFGTLVLAACSSPPTGYLGGAGRTAAPPGSPSAGEANLRVTVLLESGRPDPTFTIDDGDGIGEVAQMFAAAKPDPGAAPGQTVLSSARGYKGIVIENPHGEGALPRKMTVYKDRLQAQDDGGEHFFTGGTAFESFLIDQGVRSKALDDKAVALIRPAPAGAQAQPH